MESTKKCKKCYTDIPSKASVCPNCKSDLRSWFSRHPIISLLLVLFIIGAAFSDNLNTNNGVKSGISSSSVQETSPEEIARQQEIQKQNKIILDKIILKPKIEDQYGFTHLVVNIKNTTGKDIDGIKIGASFKNNFGEQVLESISRDLYFYGISQELLKNGKSDEYNRQLSLFDNATKVDQFFVSQVHFTDGTSIDNVN